MPDDSPKMSIIYFHRRIDRDKIKRKLDDKGIPYIANGIALACSKEDAMMIMLTYPHMICKSDNNAEFIARWITLIQSCNKRSEQ